MRSTCSDLRQQVRVVEGIWEYVRSWTSSIGEFEFRETLTTPSLCPTWASFKPLYVGSHSELDAPSSLYHADLCRTSSGLRLASKTETDPQSLLLQRPYCSLSTQDTRRPHRTLSASGALQRAATPPAVPSPIPLSGSSQTSV